MANGGYTGQSLVLHAGGCYLPVVGSEKENEL